MKRENRIRFIVKVLLIVLALGIAASAYGCGGQEHAFEPDITPEYLQGEYADQLIRDGAEVVFGTIDVTGTVSGTPAEGEEEAPVLTQLTIIAKEYVADESVENGYYIADKNKAYITYAADDARIACDLASDGTLQVCPLSQFVDSYDESAYFDIYLFDDQVLLIVERIF